MKSKNKAVLYIHGQGGNTEEAKHYIPLFPDSDVIGLDYVSEYPWDAEDEFPALFDLLCGEYESVTLIANSIGAYYAVCSLSEKKIEKAYFISPIVDMSKLIYGMMAASGISEDGLREKGTVVTGFGQELSWKYLTYAREREMRWEIPTHILYGSLDGLTSYETVSEFAVKIGAALIVMKNGEHWFHTEEEMKFLDDWLTALE